MSSYNFNHEVSLLQKVGTRLKTDGAIGTISAQAGAGSNPVGASGNLVVMGIWHINSEFLIIP